MSSTCMNKHIEIVVHHRITPAFMSFIRNLKQRCEQFNAQCQLLFTSLLMEPLNLHNVKLKLSLTLDFNLCNNFRMFQYILAKCVSKLLDSFLNRNSLLTLP